MPQARDEAGNIWEVDTQGNPVRLVSAGAPQMPGDPSFPFEGPKAAADATKAGIEARVAGQTADAQVAKAVADAAAAQAAAAKAQRESGQSALTAEGATKLRAQLAGAENLAKRIGEIETRFNRDFSASGVAGLKEYLPGSIRPANQEFNDAGNAIMGDIAAAYGLSAQQQNTPTEMAIRFGPFIPKATDRDEVIRAKIARLKEIAQAQTEQATKQLQAAGALPAGMGTPPAPPTSGALPFDSNPGGGQAAATGATRTIFDPDVASGLNAMVQQERPYSEAAAFARQNGFPAPTPQQYAAAIEWQKVHPNAPYDAANPTREVPTTSFQRFVTSPVGGALAGAADMGSFGVVRALGGGQLDAIASAQPVASALGQIGGAIGGTAGISAAGRALASRVLPEALATSVLSGGGKLGMFGRNLAADTTFGGTYGGLSGEGAGKDALLSAAGSAVGQGVGSGIGRVIGGAQLAPAVRTLRGIKIPMTVPQQLGGFAKATEDKAISLPLVGDMIRARRMEGIDAFNRKAFDEAGRPIGAGAPDIGQEGLQALGDKVSDAYGRATNGVSVPLDNQFLADLEAIAGRAGQFPKDYRTKYAKILENRVAPFADTGNLTGNDYQQALRALKQQRANAAGVFPGFEEEYRGALSDTMDALTGQMQRGGGADVVSGLNAANAANRNLKTLEDAATRAAGGSETGTPFVFTPSQLQRAGLKTEAKYPGPRPFAELADAGQEVLPSRIPDSGTAGRLAQMAVPGLLAGSGAGLGYAAGGSDSAQTGAGLSTLAALTMLAGGTRTGQKALQRVLIDRPDVARQLGRNFRKYKGMFGSAAIPLALEAGN